jgi:hypothetical protein
MSAEIHSCAWLRENYSYYELEVGIIKRAGSEIERKSCR